MKKITPALFVFMLIILLLSACSSSEKKTTTNKARRAINRAQDSTTLVPPNQRKRFGTVPNTYDNQTLPIPKTQQTRMLSANGYRYEHPQWSKDVLNAMKERAREKAGNDIVSKAGLASPVFDGFFDPTTTPLEIAKAIDNAYNAHVSYFARSYIPNPNMLSDTAKSGEPLLKVK